MWKARSVPRERFADRDRLKLGCGPSDRLLVEHLLTAGADLALDVIRNPSTLPDRMDRDCAVLVTLEGHPVSSG